MAVNTTTQLRSFIEPIWQEISSLWSGVDFSFSDPLSDAAEQSEQAFFPGAVAGDPDSGINRGHYEHCW
jgi:hypothetical protein